MSMRRFFRPCRDLVCLDHSRPSVKTLGYFRCRIDDAWNDAGHRCRSCQFVLLCAMISRRFVFLFVAIIVCSSSSLFADEGMWLFNNPPMKQLKAAGFEPDAKWLNHV